MDIIHIHLDHTIFPISEDDLLEHLPGINLILIYPNVTHSFLPRHVPFIQLATIQLVSRVKKH